MRSAHPFLLRLFCIQHDCGHGSFFGNRTLSDWTGRTLGVLTLTPYDVWRRTHSIHHSHAGDLDERGIGDVMTLTVEEYHQRSRFGQLLYRAYRHPLVMFGIGPTYLFFLTNLRAVQWELAPKEEGSRSHIENRSWGSRGGRV